MKNQIKIRTARQWNTFYPHLQGLDLTFEQSFSVNREDFLIHSLLPREGPKMNRMSTESYTSWSRDVLGNSPPSTLEGWISRYTSPLGGLLTQYIQGEFVILGDLCGQNPDLRPYSGSEMVCGSDNGLSWGNLYVLRSPSDRHHTAFWRDCVQPKS